MHTNGTAHTHRDTETKLTLDTETEEAVSPLLKREGSQSLSEKKMANKCVQFGFSAIVSHMNILV